jgi:hypothetical protein
MPEMAVEEIALSIEERVARLERISLLNYHSVKDEGDALMESVTRLGLTAESLTAALAQVDKNQSVLMGVRRDIQAIKDSDSPSRTEAEAESARLNAQSRLDRLRVKTIAFSASVVALAVIGTAGIGLVVYTKVRDQANIKTATLAVQVCQERGHQADAMRTFIKIWETNVMANPGTSAQYKAQMAPAYKAMLDGYAPVDCTIMARALNAADAASVIIEATGNTQ